MHSKSTDICKCVFVMATKVQIHENHAIDSTDTAIEFT